MFTHTRVQMGSVAPDNSWEYHQWAIKAQVLQTERILTCLPETSNVRLSSLKLRGIVSGWRIVQGLLELASLAQGRRPASLLPDAHGG